MAYCMAYIVIIVRSTQIRFLSNQIRFYLHVHCNWPILTECMRFRFLGSAQTHTIKHPHKIIIICQEVNSSLLLCAYINQY